jgi:hypothetical protein
LIIVVSAASFQRPAQKMSIKSYTAVIDKAAKSRIEATLKSFVDSGKIAGVSALVFEKKQRGLF